MHLGGHVGDAAQVGAAARSQRGVHDGGDRALVLAHLRRDLVRAGDVVTLLAQRGAATACSWPGRRSACRRHTATPPTPSGTGGTASGRAASSSCPSRVEPPADLEPPRARHERRRPHHGGVVERGPVLPADLDDVAEALGGDERDRGRLPLQQGVGGDRGAVGERRRAARRRARRCPSRTARPGSSGVDSTLATVPSAATTSVKVPPVSAPTRMDRTVPACAIIGGWPLWSRKRERARSEPEPAGRGAASRSVHLDDDDHAWWAQAEVDKVWKPRDRKRAEPEEQERDILAEHFGDDWRTNFLYTGAHRGAARGGAPPRAAGRSTTRTPTRCSR